MQIFFMLLAHELVLHIKVGCGLAPYICQYPLVFVLTIRPILGLCAYFEVIGLFGVPVVYSRLAANQIVGYRIVYPVQC